jgi:Gpi18-like mannosyltransferase
VEQIPLTAEAEPGAVVPPSEKRDTAVRLHRLVVLANQALPFAIVLGAAVALRAIFFPIESGDLHQFLEPWWNELKEHGHFRALKTGFSNYAPAYLYFLALASYLPVTTKIAVKVISVMFDGVLAAAFLGVVWPRVRTPLGRLVALALPLLAPTVLFNGAAWGQCDVIYTAFIVLSLGAALKDRWAAASALAGVALAFKVQTVFFLPALVLMMAQARVRLRDWATLLLVGVVFVVTLIPAWIVGRPAGELLMIYANQSRAYDELSAWAPNIYHWFPNVPFQPFRSAGVVMTGLLLGIAFCLARQSRAQWGTGERVLTAVGTTILCPFFLPQMHERYFFTADVLSLLIPFWFPRRWWISLAVTGGSMFSYSHFLFGANPFEMKYVCMLMAVSLAVVGRDWVRALALDGPPS